jgi:hypothetical protein
VNRKPTKTTRGPNADEKRFQGWLKEQPCCVTGVSGPSIVHHCEGATFKHNKVLVGHWFCLPLCQEVDDVITHGSRKAFRERYGPQSDFWRAVIFNYDAHCSKKRKYYGACGGGGSMTSIIDYEVYDAIMDWNR